MGRVSVHELEKQVSGGLGSEDLLIDVREPDEFASGHVPGAENIPLSNVAGAVTRISGRKRLFVICQRGGRSIQACGELAGLLGSEVALFNVDGGTSAWIDAGFKVDKT